MSDVHNRKAGNRGDVWKHFILSSVVSELLLRYNDGKSFTYVDTHCSIGRFPLPTKGQWKQGVGRFYDNDGLLGTHLYFAAERKAYRDTREYLGSWALVKSFILSRGVPGNLRLFDTSDSVAHHLRDEEGFSQSSGFDAALSDSLCPDLIFVDPAYSERRDKDWRSVRELATRFIERGTTGLIWYPVFVKERSFADVAGVIAEIRWPAPGVNQVMRGCGIVAFGSAMQIVTALRRQLVNLADLLGGALV